MRKSLSILIILMGLLQNREVLAAAGAIPVSVQKFENRAADSNCRHNWDWWGRNLGTAFSDILIDELGKNPKYQVLERETIKEIYSGEFELVNSEESIEKPVKGKFEKARYVFVGSVTEFEYCVGSNNVGVGVSALAALAGHSIPSLNVGFSTAKTHVGVTLRIIEVSTGRILKTVKGEAKLSDSKVNLESDFLSFEDQKLSPIGKTIQSAIADGVSKINI